MKTFAIVCLGCFLIPFFAPMARGDDQVSPPANDSTVAASQEVPEPAVD